jgi:hypothetical protein
MDVDKVVVVKARDDMEIDNDPMDAANDLQVLWRFTTISWRLTRIFIEND